MGYLLSVDSSPDPSLTELDSSAYFRCRKCRYMSAHHMKQIIQLTLHHSILCRRLLFTDESVLQHELGEGQAAFRWNKRSKPTASSVRVMKSDEPLTAGKEEDKSTREKEDDSMAGENDTLEPSVPLDQDGCNESSTLTASDDKNPTSPTSTASGASTSPTLTPADLARVRKQVATVVAMGNHSSPLIPKACSSYFIEPVEWMETQLLGHVEGKVRTWQCALMLNLNQSQQE